MRSNALTQLAVLALCTGLGIIGALAQENASEEELQNKWYKLCEVNEESKGEVCAVNIRVLSNNQTPIAEVRVVEQEGAPQKLLTVLMPPGLLIQPGMRVQVDGSNLGTAKFQICTPQVCIAEAAFDEKLISSLKRGNEMNIVGIDQARKQVGFKVTLAGFTAAYDGAPIDPGELAARTQTLQQKLQQKADEARQRLLDQKNKQTEDEPQ